MGGALQPMKVSKHNLEACKQINVHDYLISSITHRIVEREVHIACKLGAEQLSMTFINVIDFELTGLQNWDIYGYMHELNGDDTEHKKARLLELKARFGPLHDPGHDYDLDPDQLICPAILLQNGDWLTIICTSFTVEDVEV